jgi:hypothetical protein
MCQSSEGLFSNDLLSIGFLETNLLSELYPQDGRKKLTAFNGSVEYGVHEKTVSPVCV